MNSAHTRSSILVVEDHPVFRKFLLSWLAREFEVTVVQDGLEALKWLQAGNVPDAVLLDMEMPRINGYEFLRNVRFSGIFGDLPVVALTSHDRTSVLERLAEYGVDKVFSKPYQPQRLQQALRDASSRAYSLQVA